MKLNIQKESHRVARINDLILKELAVILQQEMKDPRLEMVTITEVDVAPNLAHAKVYFTVMAEKGTASEQQLALLNKAAGFLRSQLGSRIVLRYVPALRFFLDTSMDRGNKLDTLLDQID
ncbi:MAG: ribosome-binding factor A [marine bacterium B5-7]|nr:MAG: ribosome-binding factor A [marine bacterium B5-7]